MQKYDVKKYKYKTLKDKVVLPKFQRKLVWSNNEKMKFIESLKKGFPFGSILIYKYEEEEKYSLIDGLQRYTTLDEFTSMPEKYLESEINDFVKKISNFLPTHIKENISSIKEIEINIFNIVTNFIIKFNKDQRVERTELVNNLKENVTPLFIGDLDPSLKLIDLQGEIEDTVNKTVNIKDLDIPCIEFEGDESELAEVFQNLNTGGKKLTKYQVFAAQWSKYQIQLNDSKYNAMLLNEVIDRYKDLLANRRDISIEGFDVEEMENSKTINLSELCYALGKIITDLSPVFWSKNKGNEELANEIGYSTIGIVLGVSNNKLHEIINYKEFFDDPNTIEEMVSQILSIFNELNNYFGRYLSHPGTTKIVYENKAITNFQVLSFFASLWSIKIDVDNEFNTISQKNNYRRSYDSAKKNFIHYLVRDVVVSRWSGTGDRKLNDIYINKNNRYKNKISKKSFEFELSQWLNEDLANSSIQFNNVSKLILTVAYSNNSHDFESSNYHLEHVIPKYYLKEKYKLTNPVIPAGNLGNMMFLSDSVNTSKRQLTLYEVIQEGHAIKDKFIDLSYYPSEQRINKVIQELEKNNTHDALQLIKDRATSIINKLIDSLFK
ncbi:DUF262 domain-containing protein [Filobacillus milosensis]|uniref:DUF262 domain-containing protein n=1 Tax=Filobacillus milosensis TaxID=94137 RepID=A0A4Y8IJ19_9BACI|nr:DUF262 domain-containing protein [Filobacillus milosensis]TFB19576.1 DUF262 domain-containing protein [Filobacillus milosensis]